MKRLPEAVGQQVLLHPLPPPPPPINKTLFEAIRPTAVVINGTNVRTLHVNMNVFLKTKFVFYNLFGTHRPHNNDKQLLLAVNNGVLGNATV